ncbi:diguanylate cyclase domain-containing protein [Paenibacillus taiwanensis]|uniref:diguanylate cyclase domain-containing protein n=1 Tax=Paenibacillus taiwanensis TaxID=401638 RepID=UPI0003FB291D|nr:diguanylate cyclase [Paenibacillus taiwanensis]
MMINLVANLSLMLVISFVFSLLYKSKPFGIHSDLKTKVIVGVIYGSFGILLMMFSVNVTPSVILDFRQIVIISAAFLGGIPSALISSLIIVISRGILFGAFNSSSIIAMISALILGIGSGIICTYTRGYWQKWIFSLVFSIIVVSSCTYILIGNEGVAILPLFVVLVMIGGLFKAFLVRYFMSTNKQETELRANEERYRLLHSHLEAILQSATGVAIIATDHKGHISLFNKGAELLLGYTEQQMIGKSTSMLFDHVIEISELARSQSGSAAYRLSGSDILRNVLHTSSSYESEWTYQKSDGTIITVNLIVTSITDNADQAVGYLGVATDITERKEAEAKMREANAMFQKLSTIDGLTDIPNRRSFDQEIIRLWEQANQHDVELSLIMLDIDCFKQYNDTYGHQRGDDCLKIVTRELQRTLARDDMLARYGGEEFAVLLPGSDLEQASRMAERIRSHIEEMAIRHESSTAGRVVSISAGIASRRQEGVSTPSDLIRLADRALYDAKAEGRNRVKASGAAYVMNR